MNKLDRAFAMSLHLLELSQKRWQAIYEWKEEMKNAGIEAGYPNDGWIDKENQIITPLFPSFSIGIEVGSLVAIGDYEDYTIVQLVEEIPQPRRESKWRYRHIFDT